MFRTAPGNILPNTELILEEFQIYEGCIRANISYEKLKPLIEEFYGQLPEPLFFVLQIPLSEQEEEQIGLHEMSHEEVLYLDGQTKEQIDTLFKSYGQILFADGISQFAVASHVTGEEIFIQKYKITDIYSSNVRNYIPLLQKYGLRETDRLVTAWDTFSKDAPGICKMVALEGLDVYQIAGRLKKQGLYRAKIVSS